MKFKNLVESVEKQARIALEPVFDDIIDLTITSKGDSKTKPSDTKQGHKPTSRGSSFATALISLPKNSDITAKPHPSKGQNQD